MSLTKKYELKFDKQFLKRYRKGIDKSQQRKIDKKIISLESNPTKGKPLFNIFPNLYELYAESYRIYYVVLHQEIKIIMLAYEHKNNQKKFLNKIKQDKLSFTNKLKENL